MARIVAPTVANLTYSRTVDSVPQLVFLGIAACFFAAGVASVLRARLVLTVRLPQGVKRVSKWFRCRRRSNAMPDKLGYTEKSVTMLVSRAEYLTLGLEHFLDVPLGWIR
jgi:hypothetical protein